MAGMQGHPLSAMTDCLVGARGVYGDSHIELEIKSEVDEVKSEVQGK